MTAMEFFREVKANRDALEAKFVALMTAGDHLSAGALLPNIEFAGRQTDEAALAAVQGRRL